MDNTDKLTRAELTMLVENINKIERARLALIHIDKTIQNQDISLPATNEALEKYELKISKLEQETIEIRDSINRLATIIADDIAKLSTTKLSRKQKKELLDISFLNAQSRESKKATLSATEDSLKKIKQQHNELLNAKENIIKMHSSNIEKRYDLIHNYNKMAKEINQLTHHHFELEIITDFSQISKLKPTPTMQDLNEYLSNKYIIAESCESQN